MLSEIATHIYVFWHAFAEGSSNSSDTFKIAIVATSGTVISAGFAALAIIVPRHRDSAVPPIPLPPPPSPPQAEDDKIENHPLTKELRSQIAQEELIAQGQAAMIERLRSFCWNNGLDPIRFRKMRHGESREDTIPPHG